MLSYIRQIQEKLVSQYKFKTNKNGYPEDVPDGDYPMVINGKKDNVKITNGYISCGNFETE